MEKPIYFSNLNGYFNGNIEMIRDIADTIGTDKMVNAYGNLSFGVTENSRIVVMIENRQYNDTPKYVCVEYQGDGIATIEPTDAYGNKISNNHNIDKLFDTHAYYCHESIKEAFHKRLKEKFGIII